MADSAMNYIKYNVILLILFVNVMFQLSAHSVEQDW